MAFTARTDMACELIDKKESEGIRHSEKNCGGIHISEIEISTPQAAQQLQKEQGTYITVNFEGAFNDPALFDEAILQIAQAVRSIADTNGKTSLIAGLGNRKLASDALGPLTTDRIIITRHLRQSAPHLFEQARLGVTAQITPDVLGKTGIESAEAVRSAAQIVKPDVIFIIDALAAREMRKLCACVQISNTGLRPGSGIGNHRMQLDQATLGTPVISIGVPTVMDALTLASDIFQQQPDEKTGSAYDKHLIVAPKDVDILVKNCAVLVSTALNKVFHNNISEDEIQLLTEM